jgi:hypothetical protein
MIGDQHFQSASKYVKFYTYIQNPPKPRKQANQAGVANPVTPKLTAAQLDYNNKHQRVRSRVESPYGNLKLLFKSLAVKWRDTTKQLEYLVIYSIAINNMKRQLNIV